MSDLGSYKSAAKAIKKVNILPPNLPKNEPSTATNKLNMFTPIKIRNTAQSIILKSKTILNIISDINKVIVKKK